MHVYRTASLGRHQHVGRVFAAEALRVCTRRAGQIGREIEIVYGQIQEHIARARRPTRQNPSARIDPGASSRRRARTTGLNRSEWPTKRRRPHRARLPPSRRLPPRSRRWASPRRRRVRLPAPAARCPRGPRWAWPRRASPPPQWPLPPCDMPEICRNDGPIDIEDAARHDPSAHRAKQSRVALPHGAIS